MARPLVIGLMVLFFLGPAFSAIKKSDRQFLEMIEEKTFHYFWDEANPENGLVPDATKNRNCSISVTGFGLAALCIADARGWIKHKEAYERVLVTLRSFADYPGNPSKTRVEAEHGHPYHWVDLDTGEWIGQEGIFPTDTAAFIAGVLTAGEYFKGTEIEKLSDMIYRNVDWTWFLNKEKNRIFVGWTPSGGFFGEFTMTEVCTLFLLLALGSPTYPVPVEAWYTLGNSYYHAEYKDYSYVGDGAAYMHQWPFCFIDPRLKKDYFLDYSLNLREFSLASRRWCQDHQDEGYGPDLWGLNPCVGPDKYGEYAAPVIPGVNLPYNGKDNDGTVAPTAALSFMPFTPEESLDLALILYSQYKEKVFGDFGFYDSLNLKKDFWCDEYLGIDQGPIVIMIDNYLKGTVWKNFMKNKYVLNALTKIGFTGLIDNFDNGKHAPPYARWYGLKGGFEFSRDIKKFKEGEGSLKVELKKGTEDNLFVCEPLLQDVSPYRYLCFWKSSAADLAVYLEDEKKKSKEIKLVSRLKENEWELCSYDLSELKKKIGAVKKILFKIKPPFSLPSILYLDFVHMSDKLVHERPDPPSFFKAKTGESRGETDLSWQLPSLKEGQGVLAHYTIKISENPLRTREDFEKASPALADFIPVITQRTQTMTLGDLVPGKKYYFGMCVENHLYCSSDMRFGEAFASSQKELFFQFSPLELVAFDLSEWEGFSSEGDEVRLSKTKAREGDGLALQYKFVSSAAWHWAGVRKKIQGRLKQPCEFVFQVKGKGLDPNIEFKLMDKNGSVFGKKIDDFNFNGEWGEVVIDSSELTYWWGGKGSKVMGLIDFVEIAFSTDQTGEGNAVIHKLVIKR